MSNQKFNLKSVKSPLNTCFVVLTQWTSPRNCTVKFLAGYESIMLKKLQQHQNEFLQHLQPLFIMRILII